MSNEIFTHQLSDDQLEQVVGGLIRVEQSVSTSSKLVVEKIRHQHYHPPVASPPIVVYPDPIVWLPVVDPKSGSVPLG
jgi:hypothetical protein